MVTKNEEAFTELEVSVTFVALVFGSLLFMLFSNIESLTLYSFTLSKDQGVTFFLLSILLGLSLLAFYWSPVGVKGRKKGKRGLKSLKDRASVIAFPSVLAIFTTYIWLIIYAGGLFVIGNWISVRAPVVVQWLLAITVILFTTFEIIRRGRV